MINEDHLTYLDIFVINEYDPTYQHIFILMINEDDPTYQHIFMLMINEDDSTCDISLF